MKKLFFLLILFYSSVFAQFFELGYARGYFLDVGVGPRIPTGEFADNSTLGVGGDVTFSYTDNKFIPLFFYGRIGYQHFPGNQDFYKLSEFSSISSNVILLHFGARYYFAPVIRDMVILMPVLEGGISLAYFEKSNIYKIDAGKNDFVEEKGKLGFHIGAGFSMFLLDVITSYNYFNKNQYISIDIKIRIPVFARV